MRPFGVDEYGNSSGFVVKCNKCGREGDIVPIHHYDKEVNLKYITLEVRCTCGNVYGATIHIQKL